MIGDKTNRQAVVHVRSDSENLQLVLSKIKEVLEDNDIEAVISVDAVYEPEHEPVHIGISHQDMFHHAAELMLRGHPEAILIIDDDAGLEKELTQYISLTSSYPLSMLSAGDFPCAFDFDVPEIHQEPYAGKKSEFGTFSMRHNKKALDKNQKYLNKGMRNKRFGK